MGKLILNGRNYSGLIDAQGVFIDTDNVITSGTYSASSPLVYTASQDCYVDVECISSEGTREVKGYINGEFLYNTFDSNTSATTVSRELVPLKKGQTLRVETSRSSNSRYTVYGIQMGSEVTFLSEYASACYDTNEREVGCWVDGKPIYQKTAYVQNISISANSDTSINISDYFADVDSAVCYECSSGDSIFPNIMASSGLSPYSIGVTIDKGSNHITFSRGGGGSATISVYITLRYTKTTDVAGSGSWTPMATPTHHYSTDEKVVGTWVDGKPIYETSFPITSTATFTSNSWVDMGINQGDMYKIIDGKLIMDYQGSYSFHNLQFGWISNKLVGNSFRNFEVEANHGYVVLQYTKSTD